MKLLLISDLHSQKACLNYLENAVKSDMPDGIICSGDIAQKEDYDFLSLFLHKLDKISLPAFIIWGNNEAVGQQKIIEDSKYNSHLVLREIGEWKIFGVGEVEDMPAFDTTQIKDAILITHRPPLKESLEKQLPNAPRYHIHGHLHFQKEIKKYPSTATISVPTFQTGEYGVLDLEKGKVSFKKIV